MSLLLRATLWIALYAALVLAPLGAAFGADPVRGPRPFAVELGAACGYVAFSLLVLELALVARIRSASEPFGTDVLMLFHRLFGLAGAAFLAAHVALLWSAGRASAAMLDPLSGPSAARTGAVALLAVAILVVTSLWRRGMRLPYEAWRSVHRLLAIVLVVTAAAHVVQLGVYAQAPVVRSVVLGQAAFFLLLFAWYAVLRPLDLWRRPWEVVENRDEGADTRTLVVRPAGHPGFSFQPGQFVWITTGATPFHPQQHPITISSSAERQADGRIELTIKALGDWSRGTVPQLTPGARVWVDGPFGAFSPDRFPAQGFVLVAGGIGVSPMRSILLTLRDRDDPRPVLLIYAARNPARTVFARELEELRSTRPLRVVRVYEEPGPDWTGERGFVGPELLRRHVPPRVEGLQFFVCGPPPMLEALERALEELAVPPDRVQTERYDLL